ncbi:class II fructose-bisphosphate aldolase, partial [Blautia schinkii]|uniref:class II fructose-bisphosphate aldolase n=1 Tax=Blautia schinkii TaxID=180164 RepID=UPI0023B1D9BB
MVDRSREQRYDWLKRKLFGFSNVIRHYRNSKNKNHTYIMRRKIIMPLVTSKEMLSKDQKGGYAVGAFNAENIEMVKAIIQAAEELKAP